LVVGLDQKLVTAETKPRAKLLTAENAKFAEKNSEGISAI
jgi:hypothetical protein